MTRRIFVLLGLIIGGLTVWIVVTRVQAFAKPEQPIDFSHRIHIDSGLKCLYCHTNAMRSPDAGIPSVQKCIGCHQVIAVESDAVQDIKSYWENKKSIPWVRVNRQPDFVYFSHQPHTNSGVSCERCHGDVGTMDSARPVLVMDMGWCINCHRKQSEEKIARLSDCLICHK